MCSSPLPFLSPHRTSICADETTGVGGIVTDNFLSTALRVLTSFMDGELKSPNGSGIGSSSESPMP